MLFVAAAAGVVIVGGQRRRMLSNDIQTNTHSTRSIRTFEIDF